MHLRTPARRPVTRHTGPHQPPVSGSPRTTRRSTPLFGLGHAQQGI
ncbi:hypothetical protein [Streptomyces anthocyanicus]